MIRSIFFSKSCFGYQKTDVNLSRSFSKETGSSDELFAYKYRRVVQKRCGTNFFFAIVLTLLNPNLFADKPFLHARHRSRSKCLTPSVEKAIKKPQV